MLAVFSNPPAAIPPAPVTPAGSGTELQFRNGSAFGAITGSSWNGSTLTIPGEIQASNGISVAGNGKLFTDADGVLRFEGDQVVLGVPSAPYTLAIGVPLDVSQAFWNIDTSGRMYPQTDLGADIGSNSFRVNNIFAGGEVTVGQLTITSAGVGSAPSSEVPADYLQLTVNGLAYKVPLLA